MTRILICLLLYNPAPSLFHKGPPVPIGRRERGRASSPERLRTLQATFRLSPPWEMICFLGSAPGLLSPNPPYGERKPLLPASQPSSEKPPTAPGPAWRAPHSGRRSAYQQQSLRVACPVPGAGRDAGWLDSWNALPADKLRSAAQPPGSSKETVQPCQGKSQ